MLGLYVHIPFCSAICNYCNFNRGLFDADLKSRYVDAVVTEIQRAGLKACAPGEADDASEKTAVAQPVRAADTIYFGGGTPSLLEPDEIARIIAACDASFDIAADSEITLEANPETVTEGRLAAFRDAGINRLSFGVQSFRDQELRRLSRLHSADRARAALAEARAAGFDNVSLDLMMWLPSQHVDEWLDSVDQAIDLAPEHLSLYMLEIYPNAPLKDTMARSAWSQAPDDDVAEMYLLAMDRLDQAGYLQYEISNVARPGRQSRHNLKYWSDGAWIGFGCGAHSTEGGIRWKNVAGIEEYLECLRRRVSTAVDVRRMTKDERLGDALFTGLRLTQGVDTLAIRARYGVDVLERYRDALAPFADGGLLETMGERLRLSRRGMLLAHEVMTVFV